MIFGQLKLVRHTAGRYIAEINGVCYRENLQVVLETKGGVLFFWAEQNKDAILSKYN